MTHPFLYLPVEVAARELDAKLLIAGGDGNDTLGGGRGADSLAGGAGDDVYVIGSHPRPPIGIGALPHPPARPRFPAAPTT